MIALSKIFGVFRKEFKSEFKTKSSLASVFLFIVTTITIVGIGIGSESIDSRISGAILWVILFFSAMTGLSRIFIAEEERGTALLLQVLTPSYSVYFGKLFYNIFLSLVINFFTVILFLFLLNQVSIASPLVFLITLLLSSLGMASATTIISALISKAGTKNALFPVLAFPVLLPLVFVSISLTVESIEGTHLVSVLSDFGLLFAYFGTITSLSYVLFDFIWKE